MTLRLASYGVRLLAAAAATCEWPSGRSAVASGWLGVAIRTERVTHACRLRIEWPLRDSRLQRRNRRYEAGNLLETGEDVVGSHGGRSMPYDHVQYRTLPTAHLPST
ncbi:MAG: hypothetical protein ACR2FP_09885, partial [Nocardioidaceae bacterium]